MLFTILLTSVSASTFGHGAFFGVHGGFANYSIKKVFKDNAAKKVFEDKLAADATLKIPEVKAGANNGLLGLHAGFTKRLFNKIGIGASVEGHKAIGNNLKISGVDTQKFANFGINFLTHAQFFVKPQAFIGVEVGLGAQGFKSPIETKYSFSPLTGVSFGYFLHQKVAAKINVRYGWPVKQGNDAGISSKPAAVTGTIGLSYYFA